jgi:Putative transposase/Transposase zinc-binding domain
VKPRYEVAQIIRDYGDDFIRVQSPLKHHQCVLGAIKICRTVELGGHIDRCGDCGYERISYNSCRNRHCPKCQNTNRERWLLARKEDVLPCTYFHVVFTIPQELNTYCLKYPVVLYNILFQASKETLFTFGNDPKHLGAQLGVISLLHTWGQNLALHPHVHMIIPGGGFTQNNHWKTCSSNGDFLFPIKAMSKVYRGKFMEKFLFFLQENQLQIPLSLRRKLYDKNWVIYAKQPFKNAEGVVEYLGRYSHKIAISNHRITDIKNGQITFRYKDYKHGSVNKLMTLEAKEFLRRLCMHILPPKFMKIRHYGFLASRVKQKLKIEQMKQGVIPHKEKQSNLNYKEITKNQLGFNIDQCPCCKIGRMITVLEFGANAVLVNMPNPPPITIQNKRQIMKVK